jgi:hypothetical protein
MIQTAPSVLRVTERVGQALELRRAGATFDEIGKAMDCTRQRAHALVKKGMARILENADQTALEVRSLELSRIDGVLRAHWLTRNNPRSAEIILRCGERRSKLLGLDAPEKIAQVTPDGEAVEEHDLSRLTLEELKQFHDLVEKITVKRPDKRGEA